MPTKTGKFLTAEWRYLAMLNYEIDPDILRPYVPAGTELDSWDGSTFVSMVGFLFLNTKVRGVTIPFHVNFEEVNLRFYVRRHSLRSQAGWQRGVVFIKELVPKVAIATMARLFYNENYAALPMRHTIVVDPGGPAAPVRVEYGWRFRQRWNYLRVQTVGAAQALVPGSQEEFITEHYWGYAGQRDGGCVEYQVEHPPWCIWQVSEALLDCDVAGLYGPNFVAALTARPRSAFLAEGSAVAVYQGCRL